MARDVRVIGPDGGQLGIMQSRQALSTAQEMGLDLVMVAPAAQPPVCRIIDYGKFKYEAQKLQKDSKKKQQDVKGIKLRPNTAEHDLNTLARNARRFLEEGDKVRVVCQFRAREITHPEIGLNKMKMFAEKLADVSMIEKPPTLDGRQMIMVLNPKSGQKKDAKKDAEAENQQNGRQAVQDHGQGEDHPAQGVQ